MTHAPGPERPRWRRAIGIAVLASIAVLAGLWFLVLPRYVEAAVTDALLRAGFRSASVRVVRIGPASAELAELALGDGAPLRAERVRVTFAPLDAVRGRMHAIVLEDVTWDPRRGTSGSALAPFDELTAAKRAAPPPDAAPSAPASAAAAPLPALPVDRMELRALRARIATPRGALELAGDARLVTDRAGWSATLVTRSDDGTRIEASADLRRDGAAAEGDVRLRVGAADAALDLRGTARLAVEEAGTAWSLDLRGDAPQLRAGALGYAVTGSGVTLELGARATPAAESGAQIAWSLGLRTAADGDLALAGERVPEALRGLTWQGALDARGELAPRNPTAASTWIRLADASLRTSDTRRIEGVQADVHVLGFGPPTTPPGQVLQWDGAQVGALRTRAGSLSFRALVGPVVRVESARWAVDEQGSMSVRGFEVDPQHLVIDTAVRLDAVPLADWLDLVGKGRVTGTGRISGDLAARVVFAPLDIDLGEGHLQAVDGGTVRFLDDPETRKLLEEHIAAGAAANAGAAATGDAAGDYQQVVKQRIVDSLADFAYEQLTFDLVAQDGHLTLRTHAVGKGRAVPQELDLEVNLNGFDELVESALDVKLGVDNAKRRLAGALAPPELERRSQ